MLDYPTRLVKIDDLRSVVERLCMGLGCDEKNAKIVADIFVEADLRGNPIQGLHHFHHGMVRGLKCKKYNGKAHPTVRKDARAYALVDGHRGPGQAASVFAADIANEKGKSEGIAMVGVVESADLYMVGYYVERIARAGLVGLLFSDAVPFVHPYGGIERMVGTNPICIGVPTAGKHPIVLDFATSAWLTSHVREAAAHGFPIPEGMAIGPDGRPTTDSKKAMEGSVGPLGGAKGFGLGMCCAFLSGALVGADMGAKQWPVIDPTTDKSCNKGHLFIAMDPAAFGDPKDFERSVSAYAKEVKDSKVAPGFKEIAMPGERSFRDREKNLKAGTVPIREMVWEKTVKLGKELGVPVPA